jgi:hypothetical protein
MLLTIAVHYSVIEKMSAFNIERVEETIKDFAFDSFEEFRNGYFGFDNSFSFHKQHPWILLRTLLPSTIKTACGYCGGNPKNFPSGCCRFCENTGLTHQINTPKATAICASLALLFKKILYQEDDTDSGCFQVMTISTSCLHESNDGFAMSGTVSPFGAATFAKSNSSQAEEAMRNAYQHMTANYSSDKYRVRNEDGQFHLTCPGNACGIDPTMSFREGGYEFQSHNMGSPIQQLTILAGLATLCTIANERF